MTNSKRKLKLQEGCIKWWKKLGTTRSKPKYRPEGLLNWLKNHVLPPKYD